MGYKDEYDKKHFYTFCITRKSYVRKSSISSLMFFYNYIEKTLNEFPKIENLELDLIRKFLNNIYLLISKPEENEEYLKYAVYLEEKAEELEKEGLKIIKHFIDFSSIDNKEIKELNNLRINLRILESLFWDVVKNKEIENNGLYLVIPHFLNVSSKYVFYYIVLNYKDYLKPLEKLEIKLEYDKEKYEKYLNEYKNRNLYEYI